MRHRDPTRKLPREDRGHRRGEPEQQGDGLRPGSPVASDRRAHNQERPTCSAARSREKEETAERPLPSDAVLMGPQDGVWAEDERLLYGEERDEDGKRE